MTELDDLRRRVDALENQMAETRDAHTEARRAADLFAMVDRDVSDLRASHLGQTRVLQALRDTQIEQGQVLGTLVTAVHELRETQQEQQQTLREHGQILGEHSQILGKNSQILGEHSQVLGEHSQILGKNSQALGEHGQILGEHSQVLGEHSQALGTILARLEHQGRILERLDPGEQSSS